MFCRSFLMESNDNGVFFSVKIEQIDSRFTAATRGMFNTDVLIDDRMETSEPDAENRCAAWIAKMGDKFKQLVSERQTVAFIPGKDDTL